MSAELILKTHRSQLEAERYRLITQEFVREKFHYDPDTGRITHINDKIQRKHRGQEAGYINDQGYRMIILKNWRYRAHWIAWMYMYGEWPAGRLDHVNRIRDDNRISNLRVANTSQNNANRAVRAGTETGLKGIRRMRDGWQARIDYEGRHFHLGTFNDVECAKAAYGGAATVLFGDYKPI